jgi:hypothetical protein
MSLTKPPCGSGSASTASTFSDLWGLIIFLIGLISGAIGVITKLGETIAFLTQIWTVLGISAPALYWLGALATYVTVLIVIGVFWYKNCHEKPKGLRACSSGVIEEVFPSFDDWHEWAFPFAASHPRIDVVVKCDYWNLVGEGGATVVCNDDPQQSPILSAFFDSAEVCAAGGGALIGAAVAGIGGIVAGVAIGAAIGCSASGPFYLLCLLVVLLIVAIVVAVAALAGALIGGMIGKAAAGGDDPITEGTGLTVGDYVTTPGNLIIMGDLDNARAYWFVDDGGHTVHGRSTGSAPFSHLDPDANLTSDAC